MDVCFVYYCIIRGTFKYSGVNNCFVVRHQFHKQMMSSAVDTRWATQDNKAAELLMMLLTDAVDAAADAASI